MEPHQITKHPCPFCHKDTLEALTWPGHNEVKVSRASNNRGSTTVWKEGGFEMISDGCANCGKTKKDIMKAWKNGTSLDKDTRKKRLEQLKSLGFSGVIT